MPPCILAEGELLGTWPSHYRSCLRPRRFKGKPLSSMPIRSYFVLMQLQPLSIRFDSFDARPGYPGLNVKR